MREMESQPQQPLPAPGAESEASPRHSGLFDKALFGPHGFRAGWPAAVGALLTFFLAIVLGSIAWATGTKNLHLPMDHFGALQNILEELSTLLALGIGAFIASRMDGRTLPDYYLRDRTGFRHAFAGAAGGFLTLSLLVAVLCAGGWLRLSYAGLNTGQNLRFALLWAVGFLLVGLTEEGFFRCFLLATLVRGMNFWWAAGSVAVLTGFMLTNTDRHGAGGIYAVVALGILPCFWTHWRRLPSSQFWQTAWATSVGFGFVHTFNTGETAIGVFCTALIGFTFCVSIRVTGSVWWAIGFHSAWDWAQTYFYGTPDSGLLPEGHLLASGITGPVLWSGGKAGPEGSVLAIPLTVLVLVALALFQRYTTGREKLPAEAPSPLEQAQLS